MIHRGRSKRRRVDTQVLHPEVVRRLKAWLKRKTAVAADALLFPVSAIATAGARPSPSNPLHPLWSLRLTALPITVRLRRGNVRAGR